MTSALGALRVTTGFDRPNLSYIVVRASNDADREQRIAAVLADPDARPAIVYAGTGEGALSGDSYFGNGIIKSTDGGEHWATVSGDYFEGVSISNLVVDPANADHLFASVLRGRGAGLTLGIRPEHVRLLEAGGVAAEVTSAEYHGADTILTVRVGEESLLVRSPGRLRLANGAAVRLGWEPASVHVFDAAAGTRIDLDQEQALLHAA